MADIRPFAGIHFDKSKARDISALIAPPYDVLDESSKAALLARSDHNIVKIDLPHLPPKTVGPDATYEQAAQVMKAWMDQGVLVRDRRPAIYPYCQTFTHSGRTYHRRGLIALVRLSPFGEGHVVPHEKTYKGPIEDRLKLMRATRVQLSPIFGLFNDPRNEVTNVLYRSAGRPDLTGTMEEVQNDLWSVTDADIENQVIDLMRRRPIYIADGHHRYTTALQYQEEVRAAHGGTLPPNHPANFCMFVLVGMQDPGLLILPTHRLIGGLSHFSIEEFQRAVGDNFDVQPATLGPDQIGRFMNELSNRAQPHTFGLYEARTRRLYELRLKNLDVLAPLEPNQSEAWRRLDVAILQRYLLDEVLQPRFAPGAELTKGYTASAEDVPAMTDGSRHQLALLLRPTPLHALEELGKHGEVMPQKSTYFYPKLATGMVINPLQ